MTVRELIETLEELPYDLPVVVESHEADEVLIREEIYFTSDFGYQDGMIIKIV